MFNREKASFAAKRLDLRCSKNGPLFLQLSLKKERKTKRSRFLLNFLLAYIFDLRRGINFFADVFHRARSTLSRPFVVSRTTNRLSRLFTPFSAFFHESANRRPGRTHLPIIPRNRAGCRRRSALSPLVPHFLILQYELRLTASDNLKENYTTVVIHVKDVNDNPPVFERPTYKTQITEEDDRTLPKRVLGVIIHPLCSVPQL